jgi:biopolymer transport protein ExbD
MALKVRCPNCQELFSTRPEMSGAEITCPMCQARFELPAAESAAPKPATSKTKPVGQPKAAVQGIDAEQIGVPAPVSFPKRHVLSDDLDMTPMVDVTFLLLIFFMVTAAFSLQKSYQVPTPDDSRPTAATSLAELEEDPRYVIVRVDEYDTFHISASAWEEEQEAPSKPDLLERLRTARAAEGQPATHLLVMASEKATHQTVIAALDAGTAVGMEDVKLLTTPTEE